MRKTMLYVSFGWMVSQHDGLIGMARVGSRDMKEVKKYKRHFRKNIFFFCTGKSEEALRVRALFSFPLFMYRASYQRGKSSPIER